MKTMLKLSELVRDPLSSTSQTVSLHEVNKCNNVNQLLTVFSDVPVKCK